MSRCCDFEMQEDTAAGIGEIVHMAWSTGMDLRKQKSRQKIINSFIELRARKPLERLTVVELCARAGINKSTFYVHYKDVYDLSEQLEKELTDSIVDSIGRPERVFEDTDVFTRELFHAYNAKRNLIKIIFSGSRSNALPRLVEQSIKELVFRMRPEYREDARKNIELSYRIYGSYYAYMQNLGYGEERVVDVVSQMASAGTE